MTTLSASLSQVLAGKDSSCVDAVSRVLAERAVDQRSPCSPDSSSYCQARARLPEQAIVQLARQVGQELDQHAAPPWLWKGRHVKIVDGSTVEMADTPESQAEYPQSSTQKKGLGFPQMRIVVLFSLAVATVLDWASGPCRGKKTGEQSLFRRIFGSLQPQDIVLGDRLYDSYRDIAVLKAGGVDSVLGKKQSRVVDFRKGRRLGPHDHIVIWQKPKYDANRFDSYEEWKALPAQMEMREIKRVVRAPNGRRRTVILVTTLLDAELYPAHEVAGLFGQRWHCELDLRSLKQVLGMRRLRCESPAMARKELAVYMLGYNLVRVRMAQAATLHNAMLRRLSFTAAKTHIHNFAQPMKAAGSATRASLEKDVLKAIASSKIRHRPGRLEPRAVKKRQQKYSYLTKPRDQARKGVAT